MNNRTTVIDGVTVRDVTPEGTLEEQRERVNEVAESLILFNQNRKIKTG